MIFYNGQQGISFNSFTIQFLPWLLSDKLDISILENTNSSTGIKEKFNLMAKNTRLTLLLYL